MVLDSETTPQAPRPTPIRRKRAWALRHGLGHIPGTDGWPIVGSTFGFLRDQEGWAARMIGEYGPIYRANTFLQRSVTVSDPDLVEVVLKDKERLFSSEHGWANLVGQFFPRGLMLLDFDEHRLHRGILQAAFKKSALRGYLDLMTPRIAKELGGWETPDFAPFYPRVKRLTLDLAGVVFAGVEPGVELDRMNDAFVAMMQGMFSLLRVPLPGTSWRRATRARAFLEGWVADLIPARRAAPGPDLLSQLCAASDDAGQRLTDQQVVDHTIFLLLAAHDTTTSALTNLAFELARAPEWQERLRAQLRAVPDPLSWEDLPALGDVELALQETLRLHPPVTSIPRLALRECALGGYRIPEHTTVWLDVGQIHRHPRYWTAPATFDPDRFSEARAEHKRHPHVYFPYSSAAHVCLGKHFSVVQVKAVLHRLLTRFRLELPEGYTPTRQLIPFPKPVDDLPLRLVALSGEGAR